MRAKSVEHVYGPLESHSGQSLAQSSWATSNCSPKCLWWVARRDGLHKLMRVCMSACEKERDRRCTRAECVSVKRAWTMANVVCVRLCESVSE